MLCMYLYLLHFYICAYFKVVFLNQTLDILLFYKVGTINDNTYPYYYTDLYSQFVPQKKLKKPYFFLCVCILHLGREIIIIVIVAAAAAATAAAAAAAAAKRGLSSQNFLTYKGLLLKDFLYCSR